MSPRPAPSPGVTSTTLTYLLAPGAVNVSPAIAGPLDNWHLQRTLFAIFLLLARGRPFVWLIRIPSAPLRDAFARPRR